MHSDVYFATGKIHSACQDYAFAAEIKGQPFIVLADGCSSSPHTDVGARILAHRLISDLRKGVVKNTSPDQQQLLSVVSSGQCVVEMLSLPPACMDATLLFTTFLNDGIALAHVVGDGVVASLKKSGAIYMMSFECPAGAPEYVNYLTDAKRHEKFLREFGSKRILRTSILQPDGAVEVIEELAFEAMLYSRCFTIPDSKVLALFSDGIRTFHGLKTEQVVRELMAFKNLKGSFVQRRMKRFLKTCETEHDDDVAMAAICLD